MKKFLTSDEIAVANFVELPNGDTVYCTETRQGLRANALTFSSRSVYAPARQLLIASPVLFRQLQNNESVFIQLEEIAINFHLPLLEKTARESSEACRLALNVAIEGYKTTSEKIKFEELSKRVHN